MKIFFFGADYPPTGGGIATFTYELIHAVSKHKEVSNIRVLIFGNKHPRTETIENRTHIVTLKKIGFFYVGWETFKAFIRNRGYEIYHSLNLFPTAFWVVVWGKIFKRKTIVTFYGTDACDTSASRKTALLKKWTLKNASQALTISEFTKKQTEKKYNFKDDIIKFTYPIVPKTLLYINRDTDNNLTIDLIKNKYNINQDTFIIISVARLVKRKGTEFLIRAVSKIHDDNVKVFIIGNGPEKDSLMKLVNDLNLSNKIFILGKVDNIIPYYLMAHVSVLSSYMLMDDGDFEGLGLVLLEAQSYGVPVIGSRSGGIPETFEDGVTGILVEEQDIEELSRAIIKLKDNKILQKNLSANTRSFLERRFGYSNTINKYIELCKSL